MKKHLLFMCALLLAGIGARAQVDYSYALGGGTWAGNSGTYAGGVEVWQTTAFGSGRVLYETVTGLPEGEYELTFYAVASSTSNRDAITNDAYGDGIAQVFATAGGTTQTEDVTVTQQIACTPSDHPYTFTVTVGGDGTLEYGLQNVATGGNWYVCQGVSLMFYGEAVTRELEPGEVVEAEGEDNCLSHYGITYTGSGTNGALEYNTWSGESGMTTPYQQVWVASGSVLSDMTIDHYQIPLLPAGYYTVTVDARVLSEAGNSISTGSAFFNANGKSVDIVANATTDEDFNYNGTAEHEANGSYTIVAYVGDEGTLDIGFTITGATYNWISWKNLKIVYNGEEEPTEVHACEADLGDYDADADRYFPAHWTASPEIPAGNFHVNTWSVEADASGMTTPFCEYWIYGSTLSAATISHNTLTGLDPGVYTVSMDIRIMSETGATIGTGTTFNANGASEDLDDTTQDGHEGTYEGETEVYGRYTLTCIVYDDGKLDISIVIPEGATYNWIAWKNLSVTYVSPVDGPAIGEATVDKTVVKPGDAVTITYKKVAPEDGSYTLTGTDFTDNGISVSYTGEGVFTFTVPEDVESNSTFTVTLPEGTLAYSGDGAASSAEQTLAFSVPFILSADLMDGMFLQNLYGNDLLSRGKNLGTRADVDFVGIPLRLIMNDEGKYLIWYDDVEYGNATYAYLYGENWAWADAAEANATAFSIEEAYDGEELLGYRFVSDYGYLYRYDAADANATDYDDDCALAVNGIQYPADGYNFTYDAQAIWNFVDVATRDQLKAAWVESQKLDVADKAGLTDITTAAEFDAYMAAQETELIESDALSPSLSLDWTTTNNPTIDGSGYGVEAYQTYARLSHTATGLDEGVYKVTLNGLDRNCNNEYSYQMYQAGYTDLSESYLVAGDYETNLKPWASESYYTGVSGDNNYYPNWMNQASEMFEDGSYLNELYTYVGSDGNLEVDIALLVPENTGWAMVKNYSLYRVGEVKSYTYDVTKMLVNPSFEEDDISGITVDDRNAYPVTSVTGWTLPTLSDGFGVSDIMTKEATSTDNDFGVPGDPSNGSQMLYIRDAWLGEEEDVKLAQELTLPAGDYKITVDTKCVGTSIATATLFVDGRSTALTIHGTSNGTEDTKGNPFLDAWDTASLSFTLDAQATVSVGIEFDFPESASNGSFLIDNFKLYSTTDVVEWTMTTAGYGTLILPFDATLPSGLTAYTAAGVTSGTASDGSDELQLKEASDAIVANTPYVIGGSLSENTTYLFAGEPENSTTSYNKDGYLTGFLPIASPTEDGHQATTPDPTSVSDGYVLQNQPDASGVAFYLVGSNDGITVGAYHCYLDYTASNVKAVTIVFGDGTTTGIEAVESEADAGSDVIYDLSGRRVAKAQKGVYIVNGRKVVIK